MSQRRRRLRVALSSIAVLAVLAGCVTAAYAFGAIGMIGDSVYKNTSPPAATTSDGVTFTLAHSRYFTTDIITLMLINHSSEAIYLPAYQGNSSSSPVPISQTATSIGQCFAIATEYLSGSDWREWTRGCIRYQGCGGGTPPTSLIPVMLELKPGATVLFPIYDGQNIYPPLKSRAYRFSVLFTPDALPAPKLNWPYPLSLPDNRELTTTTVTLTNAWWYPPDYHYKTPQCPTVY